MLSEGYLFLCSQDDCVSLKSNWRPKLYIYHGKLAQPRLKLINVNKCICIKVCSLGKSKLGMLQGGKVKHGEITLLTSKHLFKASLRSPVFICL